MQAKCYEKESQFRPDAERKLMQAEYYEKEEPSAARCYEIRCRESQNVRKRQKKARRKQVPKRTKYRKPKQAEC